MLMQRAWAVCLKDFNQISLSNKVEESISELIKDRIKVELTTLYCKLGFEGIKDFSNCIIIVQSRCDRTYVEMHLDNNGVLKAIVEDQNLLNEDRKKKSKTGEILCPRNISRYAAHAKTIRRMCLYAFPNAKLPSLPAYLALANQPSYSIPLPPKPDGSYWKPSVRSFVASCRVMLSLTPMLSKT